MKSPGKITIWDGSENYDEEFDSYVLSLARSLRNHGNEVNLYRLREMEFRSCRGCWDCWVKTPGVCFHPDDHRTLEIDWLRSDLVLLVSPLKLGFITWLLKRAMERMIPILLPYFRFLDGESHHLLRYEKQPDFALLVKPEEEDGDLEMELLEENFRRVSLNLGAPFCGLFGMDRRVEEVIYAIAHS